MDGIKVDSEFKSLIPPLSEDEYNRLEQSILAEGVRDPIITWNGVIVDGHNRHSICEKHGIGCPHREHQFESRDAAKIWIIENQFGRRNISPYNRSVLALKLEPLYAAEAKRRQREAGGALPKKSAEPPIETRDKVAKAAGVSHDTIRKVKAIEAEAAKGNEVAIEAREKLMSGEEKSINSAYNSVTGKGKQRTAKESTAEDGRRICGICNEPINPGEAYDYEPTFHKKCRTNQHVVAQRKYRDASRDLRENVPTYTIESLLAQLTASAESMRKAWEQTIEINESMGVKLKAADKKRLEKAMAYPSEMLERIKESQK